MLVTFLNVIFFLDDNSADMTFLDISTKHSKLWYSWRHRIVLTAGPRSTSCKLTTRTPRSYQNRSLFTVKWIRTRTRYGPMEDDSFAWIATSYDAFGRWAIAEHTV